MSQPGGNLFDQVGVFRCMYPGRHRRAIPRAWGKNTTRGLKIQRFWQSGCGGGNLVKEVASECSRVLMAAQLNLPTLTQQLMGQSAWRGQVVAHCNVAIPKVTV